MHVIPLGAYVFWIERTQRARLIHGARVNVARFGVARVYSIWLVFDVHDVAMLDGLAIGVFNLHSVPLVPLPRLYRALEARSLNPERCRITCRRCRYQAR